MARQHMGTVANDALTTDADYLSEVHLENKNARRPPTLSTAKGRRGAPTIIRNSRNIQI